MERGVMVVKTNPVEGREDEFNAWYSNEHVPEILAVDGFVSAKRYKSLDEDDGEEGGFRYLAIYEIEGPIPDALAALSAAGVKPSSAMDEKTEISVHSSFPPAQ